MTPGERLVWAAVYAASWTAQLERARKYGEGRDELDMAHEAAAQAYRSVDALRAVYQPAEMPLDREAA